MATPLKPWEQRGAGLWQMGDTPRRLATTPGVAQASQPPVSSPPPAVPPRTMTTGSSYSGYSNYSPYSPARYYGPGLGNYGGYGGYGTYGAYGGYRPFGMFGGHGEEDSQFVRQAEEGTRVAFQSVESVVGAFASVSMMLESTYIAVHSCFRAVLGVAQHFTRLRNHVWGIITAVALLRRLRQWLRLIMRALRLRQGRETDDAWEEVSLQHPSAAHYETNRVWPAVMFFAIVFGIPWLLWKLLSSLLRQKDPQSSDQDHWPSGEGQPLVARALYDFHTDRTDELSFSAGDELVLAPRQLQNGWILAGRNRKSGLVPANYVQIIPPFNGHQPNPDGQPTPSSQEIVNDEENLLND